LATAESHHPRSLEEQIETPIIAVFHSPSLTRENYEESDVHPFVSA